MKEMRWDEWQSGHRDAPSQTNINISLLSCHCGPGVCVTADNSNYCDQVRPEPGGRCMLVSCLITFYSNIIGCWLVGWLVVTHSIELQQARQHQAWARPARLACPASSKQTEPAQHKMAPHCSNTRLVWSTCSLTRWNYLVPCFNRINSIWIRISIKINIFILFWHRSTVWHLHVIKLSRPRTATQGR